MRPWCLLVRRIKEVFALLMEILILLEIGTLRSTSLPKPNCDVGEKQRDASSSISQILSLLDAKEKNGESDRTYQ